MKEVIQHIKINNQEKSGKVIDFESYGTEKGKILINGVESSAIKVYGNDELGKILNS